MTKRDDGGNAFPTTETKYDPTIGITYEHIAGMPLRDWFAGQALTYAGDLLKTSKAVVGEKYTSNDVADVCYELADAMLKRRKKLKND